MSPLRGPKPADGPAAPPAFDSPGASGHGPRLAANSLASMAGRAASLLFWLLLTPPILHALGPERFGYWSLLFTFTSYMLIMDLGVGGALSRFAADLKARGRLADLGKYVGTTSMVYTGITLLFLVLSLLAGDWLLAVLKVPASLGEARSALILAAVGGGVVAFTSVMNGLLTGLQELVLVNGLAIAGLVPGAILIVWSLHARWGLLGVLGAQFSMALLVGLAGAWLLRRRIPPGSLSFARWDGAAARDLLGFGSWMQVTNVANLLQLHALKFFLSRWTGLVSVASYELGFRVANGILALPILPFGAMIPTAAELAARGDETRLLRLHERGMRWISAFSLPLAAGAISAAPWLVRGWLGKAPDGAVMVTRWVCVSLALSSLSGTGTAILRGMGRTRPEALCGLIALAFQLAALRVLVPSMGLKGAVLGQAASMVLYIIVFVAYFHRSRGWSWLRSWLLPVVRPLGLAVAMGLAGGAANRAMAGAQAHRLTDLCAGGAFLLLAVGLALPLLALAKHFKTEDLEVARSVVLKLRRASH